MTGTIKRNIVRAVVFLLHSALPFSLVAQSSGEKSALETAATISNLWYLVSYGSFFLFALFAFLYALKKGMFRKNEEAKYYLLTIDEPDYYTPEWAKEEEDGSDNSDR